MKLGFNCQLSKMEKLKIFLFTEVGASSNPCSDTYAGNKPFSEIETQNVRDFVLWANGTIKTYLTFHSYGQVNFVNF